jgi:Cu/Ag efflux protein CusF
MWRLVLALSIGAVLSAPTKLEIAAAETAHTVQMAHVEGQVQKIDEGAGKITLKHGPMKAFDMDEPMTMVYPVKDPSLLTGLKAGDKIKFTAERVNGQITVTFIQK